jgi:hypothetical protein
MAVQTLRPCTQRRPLVHGLVDEIVKPPRQSPRLRHERRTEETIASVDRMGAGRGARAVSAVDGTGIMGGNENRGRARRSSDRQLRIQILRATP